MVNTKFHAVLVAVLAFFSGIMVNTKFHAVLVAVLAFFSGIMVNTKFHAVLVAVLAFFFHQFKTLFLLITSMARLNFGSLARSIALFYCPFISLEPIESTI